MPGAAAGHPIQVRSTAANRTSFTALLTNSISRGMQEPGGFDSLPVLLFNRYESLKPFLIDLGW